MLNLLIYRLFFFVPFCYFFKTRLIKKSNKISWFFIYLLPILLVIFSEKNVNLSSVLSVFMYILSVYTVYEMGYIWNDTETIKNEKKPTRRLTVTELDFYEENKKLIYLSRLLLVLIFSLYFFGSNIYYFLLFNIFSILFLYVLYNSIRGVLNLPLHFLLVCFRFVTPVVAFTSISFIWVVLLFPVINLLERASENRFGLYFFNDFLLSDKKRGRYVYYLILFFILLLFNAPFSILITVVFLFFYRFASYEAIKLWSDK